MEASTKLTDILSREEWRALTRRSNARGAWAVIATWGIIAATLAALARWPHPLIFLLAVVILGGRQLSLAILMHEASHRTLFRSTWLNDRFANWVSAYWIWNDVALYKEEHHRHHRRTGTTGDPDLELALVTPVTRRALARKIARDLLGLTGLKRLVGQSLMALGVLSYTASTNARRLPRAGRRFSDYARSGVRNSAGFFLTNGALALVLGASGHGWVFAAWALAQLTTFSLFIRIRSLAEHACTERSADPFRNTRTTRAGWLARLTVAPMNVNYHLEHHLHVAVPWFRLPRLHTLLRERGFLAAPPGYRDVLARVSGAPRGAAHQEA